MNSALAQTPPRRLRPFVQSWIRRPVTWIVAAVLLAVAIVGLALFQPWKLWVDDTVDEALPGTVAATPAAVSVPAPDGPVELAHGTFISHEHTTTGTVRVLRYPDGSRILRLDDLNTSNGPALRVWLTDAPVRSGTAGWRAFDSANRVDLGELKGNIGSQNYALAPDVELSRYRSVTIWCARFHVSFGAAELTG
jgi:hypothetical protein